jgi:hypothetical protein
LLSTHNVPPITITATNTVDANAATFHRWDDDVFMCRKNTRCTRIWMNASTAIAMIDSVGPISFCVTSPKAAAVNTTDRTKPMTYERTLPWPAPVSIECAFAIYTTLVR